MRSVRTVAVTMLLLAAMAAVPSATAEADLTTFWFVGTGGDSTGQDLDHGGNYAMSTDGHGDATTTFITLLGNDLEHNPWLPTFDLPGPVTLSGAPITVHHFAAQAAAAAGCGLVGHLYAGADIIAETPVVPAQSGLEYDEFVFVFEGVSGTVAGLSFQAVQSANECGWTSIEHIWGSDDYPGRMIVELGSADAGIIDFLPEIIHTPLNATLDFKHDFTTTNGTSDIYVYNWTTDLTEFSVGWNATVENGSALLTAMDPDGIEVINTTLDATGAATADVTAFIDGQWTFTVAFSNFTGTVQLFQVIDEVPIEEHHEHEEGHDAAAHAEHVNGIFPLQSESKALPSVPAIGLLGVLAGLVVYRRR